MKETGGIKVRETMLKAYITFVTQEAPNSVQDQITELAIEFSTNVG